MPCKQGMDVGIATEFGSSADTLSSERDVLSAFDRYIDQEQSKAEMIGPTQDTQQPAMFEQDAADLHFADILVPCCVDQALVQAMAQEQARRESWVARLELLRDSLAGREAAWGEERRALLEKLREGDAELRAAHAEFNVEREVMRRRIDDLQEQLDVANARVLASSPLGDLAPSDFEGSASVPGMHGGACVHSADAQPTPPTAKQPSQTAALRVAVSPAHASLPQRPCSTGAQFETEPRRQRDDATRSSPNALAAYDAGDTSVAKALSACPLGVADAASVSPRSDFWEPHVSTELPQSSHHDCMHVPGQPSDVAGNTPVPTKSNELDCNHRSLGPCDSSSYVYTQDAAVSGARTPMSSASPCLPSTVACVENLAPRQDTMAEGAFTSTSPPSFFQTYMEDSTAFDWSAPRPHPHTASAGRDAETDETLGLKEQLAQLMRELQQLEQSSAQHKAFDRRFLNLLQTKLRLIRTHIAADALACTDEPPLGSQPPES